IKECIGSEADFFRGRSRSRGRGWSRGRGSRLSDYGRCGLGNNAIAADYFAAFLGPVTSANAVTETADDDRALGVNSVAMLGAGSIFVYQLAGGVLSCSGESDGGCRGDEQCSDFFHIFLLVYRSEDRLRN